MANQTHDLPDEQVKKLMRPKRDWAPMARMIVTGLFACVGFGRVWSLLPLPDPNIVATIALYGLVPFAFGYFVVGGLLVDFRRGRDAIAVMKEHTANRMSQITTAVHMGQLVGKKDEHGVTRYSSW